MNKTKKAIEQKKLDEQKKRVAEAMGPSSKTPTMSNP